MAEFSMNDASGESFEATPELEGYRSISRGTVIALAVALASGVAVFSPVLAILPMFGVAWAIYAWYQIDQSKGQYGGTWAVVLALILCAMFLGWSVTANLIRQQQLVARAEELAEDFLTLMNRGDKEKAHQLMTPPIRRVNNVRQIGQYYKEDTLAQETIAAAFSVEPLKNLVAWQGKYSFERLKVVSVDQEGVADSITLDYRLKGEGIPEGEVIRIILRRIDEPRSPDGHEASASWQIDNVIYPPKE